MPTVNTSGAPVPAADSSAAQASPRPARAPGDDFAALLAPAMIDAARPDAKPVVAACMAAADSAAPVVAPVPKQIPVPAVAAAPHPMRRATDGLPADPAATVAPGRVPAPAPPVGAPMTETMTTVTDKQPDTGPTPQQTTPVTEATTPPQPTQSPEHVPLAAAKIGVHAKGVVVASADRTAGPPNIVLTDAPPPEAGSDVPPVETAKPVAVTIARVEKPAAPKLAARDKTDDPPQVVASPGIVVPVVVTTARLAGDPGGSRDAAPPVKGVDNASPDVKLSFAPANDPAAISTALLADRPRVAPTEPRDPAPRTNDVVAPLVGFNSAAPVVTNATTLAAADTPAARLAGSANEQIAMHVAQTLADGGKTVTVELHPAELGRVEIHFSFHADGVEVRMTVDRPETFDAFSHDRNGLEQQLAQAGVDLGGGGLDLRLGQQSAQPEPEASTRNPRLPTPMPRTDAVPVRSWVSDSLLDIRA